MFAPMLFCRHDIAVKATNCDVVPISAAAELIGSSVKAIERAAEEAGDIKNNAHASETQTDPKIGLTCMDCSMNRLISSKSGVVTAASPKPEIVQAVVAPKGTKTMSSGVLPVRYLPTSAAINAAATALTGCPVENEGLPAA